ncbi:MAG TPA: HAMP domain-containing protein, partial [Anaerolineales bacterium]|nr:HAMP domain-containing protein [Anaerolineales bacterium]
MRSISTKLILAFLSIGIVSVAIIFLTARWNTRLEFIRFLSDQNQSIIVTNLVNYHQQYGTWEGVEELFVKGNRPGMGMGPGPHMMQPYLLADPNGYVIVPNGRYKIGEKLPEEQLEVGILLTENGTPIGFLVPIGGPFGGPFEGTPRELEFIERTSRTLFYGALGGAVIALFLGIFLSRTITRPIRELTRATQAISEGDFSQQVPVRTNDELGELARAFNKMSAELS